MGGLRTARTTFQALDPFLEEVSTSRFARRWRVAPPLATGIEIAPNWSPPGVAVVLRVRQRDVSAWQHLLPGVVNRLPVLVVVGQRAYPTSWFGDWRERRRTLARPGVAIGPLVRSEPPIGTRKWRGTLGCLVRDARGRLFGLTCQHVLASPDETTNVGDRVAMYRLEDGQERHEREFGVIAAHGRASRREGDLDAALVAVKHANEARAHPARSSVRINGSPLGIDEDIVRVQKWGAQSGHTRGKIVGVYNVRQDHDEPPAYLRGLYRVELDPQTDHEQLGFLCDKGDSGSVLWESGVESPRAVGMLVTASLAGDGFAYPMDRILGHFGVRVVDNTDC